MQTHITATMSRTLHQLICIAVIVTAVLALPKHHKSDHNTHNTQSGKQTHQVQQSEDDAQKAPNKEPGSNKATTAPWRICYWDNWSQYRPEPATHWPEDSPVGSGAHGPVSLCSHIYYAFSFMEGNDLAIFELNDEELYERMIALKSRDTNVKMILCVGGWTFGTSKFSLMFSSQENRTEFIGNVITKIRTWGFDGIDFDFEYPGARGSPPEDKYLFTCFLKEMMAAFEAEAASTFRERLLLTAGVAAGSDRIITGYEIGAISSILDKVNVMTYDLFGGFSESANPNSPVYARPEMTDHQKLQNMHRAVQTFLEGGCPAHKITIGVPAYGRGCKLANAFFNELGSPCIGETNMMNYSLTNGLADHFEICKYVAPFVNERYNAYHQVPYGNLGDQWFSYENDDSIAAKIQYIVNNNLGGFIFWTLSKDDFSGSFCGSGTYPLLKVANNGLLGYDVPLPDPTPLPEANFCSLRPDGIYPNPHDCGSFYRCWNQGTSFEICPDGTLYDDIFKGCRSQNDMNQTVVCSNCAAYCKGCYDCENNLPDLIC